MSQKQQDKGASDKSDRATRQSPSPSVSALRASIPSAVRIGTLREVIRGAPQRFAQAYERSRERDAVWKPGWTLGQIIDALNALDVETCSADDINAVMGGSSWVDNKCDLCGDLRCEVLLSIGDEPDYEARWVDLCLPCVAGLGEAAAQAIEAGTAETGTGSACESAVGEADASTILNDICNQSAEALKPLGESE